METEFMEAMLLFIVFLIVDVVLVFMIIRKKYKITPVTLKDKNGNFYTVETPGKLKIKVEADLRR